MKIKHTYSGKLLAHYKNLDYEFGMPYKAMNLLLTLDCNCKKSDIPTIQAVFLESILTHVRNIIEFFSDKDKGRVMGADLRAFSFIPEIVLDDAGFDGEWKATIEKKMGIEKTAIDRQLSHLSKHRVSLQQKGAHGWYLHKILEPLAEEVIKFINLHDTDTAKLFPLFTEAVNTYRELMSHPKGKLPQPSLATISIVEADRNLTDS